MNEIHERAKRLIDYLKQISRLSSNTIRDVKEYTKFLGLYEIFSPLLKRGMFMRLKLSNCPSGVTRRESLPPVMPVDVAGTGYEIVLYAAGGLIAAALRRLRAAENTLRKCLDQVSRLFSGMHRPEYTRKDLKAQSQLSEAGL